MPVPVPPPAAAPTTPPSAVGVPHFELDDTLEFDLDGQGGDKNFGVRRASMPSESDLDSRCLDGALLTAIGTQRADAEEAEADPADAAVDAGDGELLPPPGAEAAAPPAPPPPPPPPRRGNRGALTAPSRKGTMTPLKLPTAGPAPTAGEATVPVGVPPRLLPTAAAGRSAGESLG